MVEELEALQRWVVRNRERPVCDWSANDRPGDNDILQQVAARRANDTEINRLNRLNRLDLAVGKTLASEQAKTKKARSIVYGALVTSRVRSQAC